MINKQISKQILTISTYHKDRNGGIATIVNSLSKYYEDFNYIASTRSNNIFIMFGYFLNSIIKLIFYILFRKIQIVHIHGASNGSFLRKMILIYISAFFKIKIIYHIHGGGFQDFYQKYNKFNIIDKTLQKVDLLLVLSETWKSYFSKIINPHKIFIMNNFIEPPHTYNLVSKDSVEFLFLGHILEEKGIFDLMDIIISNKDELKKSKFELIIGGSGNTNKLLDIIESEELSCLVQFKGWVSGEEKEKLLANCDVYILPSYKEGLPISILEAMSYGKPIISTIVGGIPEIITSGYNGILVVPGDKDAISNAIKFMLNSPIIRKNMGEKNLKIIKDYYPNSVIPKLNEIYKYLIK